MGLQFLLVEPHAPSLVVMGLTHASWCLSDLRGAYEALQDAAGVAEVERLRERLEQFRPQFIAALRTEHSAAEQGAKELFSGRDLVAEEERRMEAALRRCGFVAK